MKNYTPSEIILKKYARLLVQFGLQTREGKRLAKGSVVAFDVPDIAKPFYYHLQTAILEAGYHPLGQLIPSSDDAYNLAENFFKNASKKQREFFASSYTKGFLDQIDGRIGVLAKAHPNPLANVDPKLVMQSAEAKKQGKEWFFKKVNSGNLAWTLALYGTAVSAKEAGMSEKAYWEQIIQACYLDSEDPVKEWKKINHTVQKTATKLSNLKIDKLHVSGKDVDLTVGIGADRAWRAGGGNNIPSYEVFTSPDYRRVEGWIRFNQPLYTHFGTRIEGIELTFKDGKCTKAVAKKNEKALKQLIKTSGANQLGEFSLTDARLSRVGKFMANTLYDENRGGEYGNMHVAIGSAYRDCYQGKTTPRTNLQWDKRGYNDSVVHEDIVSTSNRTVEATLQDGSKKIIYQDGQFTV